MAYTTIDNPELYFQTKTYTGNASTNAITLDGSEDMQPDMVWLKSRSFSQNHELYDAVRGATKRLYPNGTYVEDTNSTGVTAFNSDGFTLGSSNAINKSGETFASWNWKAGTSFTNDASGTGIGSIDSAGSASDASGFSIVSYTGTGSAGTIKHGLSTAPKMIIQKNRDETQPWWVYFSTIGAGGQLRLNGTNAEGSDGGVLWNSTAPTSSVFSVGDNTGTNGSSDKCIAYCFAEKKGFSKFGSYTGNGNIYGPFIYTGFKPAFTIIKRITDGTESWILQDNKRSPTNPSDVFLTPNSNNADATTTNAHIDYLSNGFKLRHNDTRGNTSGITYIYMAFAENPFVTSTGIPTTAR